MPDKLDSPTPSRNWAASALGGLAMVLLLVSVVARAFVAETPFHVPQLTAAVQGAESSAGKDVANVPIDRSELSRVSFAVLLLAAGAAWLAQQAVSDRPTARYGALAAMIVAFAVLCGYTAFGASDKRSALTGWLEQVSLLVAAFLAAQVFRERKRFVLLLVVLAAVGGAMAAKSFSQCFMEIPERVQMFLAYRDEQIRMVGLVPGTPQAEAFTNRVIHDDSTTGFWSLANLFASLLIILLPAGVGLAADKLADARRKFAAWKAHAAAGELHTPIVAAILSAVLAATIVPALFLTRSRGGILAGLGAIAAAGLVWRFRETLASRWKKNLVRAGIIAVLLGGAVAAYGIKYDSLPIKSMAFRWYYWTATAEIIRDYPLGVGPGNFPNAYLAHRRAAGEEAVKMPHNFVLQALAEYGVPGGLCFLGVIVYVLVGVCRPKGVHELHELHEEKNGKTVRPQSGGASPGPLPLRDIRVIRGQQAAPSDGGCFNPLILVPVVLALPLARVLVSGSGADPSLLVFDAVLPTIVFVAMLAAFGWFGRRYLCGLDLEGRFSRIAMACGLACFLLHDLIEFALFMPGAATAFWVAAGACLAQAPAREAAQEADRPDLWRKTHLPKWGVVLGLVAVAAAVNFLWVPVFQRTVLTQEMVNACRRNPPPRSEDLASLAVRLIKVDELDPYAASEATRLLMNVSPRTAPEWAAIVADRDPASSNLRHLLADAGLNRAWPKAVQYAWMGLPADAAKEEGALREAMKFEPPNVAMLSRLAGLLMAQGKAQESIRTLEQAVKMEPDTPTLRVLLGDVLWRSAQWEKACEAWQRAADLTRDGDSEAYLTPMARAVELNPNDIRLRLAYAEMLLWADRPAYAQRELAQAEAINAQLLQSNPESIERLKPAEAEQVKILRARAECLAKRPRIN